MAAGLKTIGKQGLEVLVNPENPTVDIIAIPGLGANPTRSWLANEKDPKSFNWLTDKKDGLPKDFSNARIILFQYASAYHGAFKIRQYLTNIARTLLERLHVDRQAASRRPIVLIGHSMGGLVAAKVLALAEQHRTSFPNIYESIVGCVTFGTPFDGAPVADIAQQWAQINEKLGTSINSKLLDLLKPGNEALRELKNEFVRYIKKLTPNVELYCFYEQKETKWDDLVAKLTSTDFPPESLAKLQLKEYREFVSRESATISGYEELGLARTHRDLVRFEGIKDPDYQIVRGVLRRIVNGAARNSKSRFNCTRQTSIDRDTYMAVVEALEGAEVEKKLRSLTQRFKLSSSGASDSWITKEVQYRSWLENEDPGKKDDYLWIHGPEGNGKTAAVASVVKEIKTKIQDDEIKHPDRPPTLLAYFFCDSQATDFGTAEDLVKSLLRQLCQQQDVLATYAKNFIPKKRPEEPTGAGAGSGGGGGAALSIENLWQCLRDMLTESSVGSIYFVVGNLHELPEPENNDSTRKLLSFLQAAIAEEATEHVDGGVNSGNLAPLVGGGSRVRTKWLLSSRDRKSIQTVLQRPPTVREIDLEDPKYGNQIKRELQKHARARVETLEKQKGYNRAISWFAGTIIGTLAESTKWIDVAVVQLASLPANSSDITVRKMLERVPQDFAALLDRAWAAVLVQAGDDLDVVKELLRALVLTYQDPTESELLVLTGLSSQRSTRDPDPDDEKDRQMLRRLIDTCKPMLVHRSLPGSGELEIGFVNPDVKKHLRARAVKFIDLPEDEIKLQHGILALRCYTHVVESVTHFLQNPPPAAPLNPVDGGKSTDQPQGTWVPGTAPSVAGTSPPVPEDLDAATAGGGSVYAGSEWDSDMDSYWSDDEPTQIDSTEPAPQDAPGPVDPSASPPTDGNQQQQPQQKAPTRIILPYAAKNWLRHASEATPDIAERLSQEEDFWAPKSEVRHRWLVEYNEHTNAFEGPWPLETFMALHVAASIGFPNLVQSLMKAGHQNEVHEYDAWTNTPLHLAAWLGNTEIVELLLSSGGAKIDDAGPQGTASTPLAMAAQDGRHLDVMQKLLSWGASPDAVYHMIGPVINGAILSGNVDAVQLLIHHNARLNYDLDGTDRYWMPPLATAAQSSDLAMLDAILAAAADKLSEEEYSKALISAAISGRVELVDRLMAEYMPRIEYLQAALEVATEESNWDVVRMLLRREYEQGPLDCNAAFKAAATSSESYAIVKDILNAAWEHSGGTIEKHVLDECLYICTDNEKEETVKLLLEMGASPDAEGEEYGNALAAAANDGTMGILHALLDKGATIDSPAGYPLQAACKQGHLDAVKLLLTHPRSPPGLVNTVRRGLTPLQAAVQSGQAEVVKYLLEQGADPNIAGEDDLPILVATLQGNEDVVESLLTKSPVKVNVNVISKFYGCSPLHNAVNMLPAKYVEMLLQAGADIEMYSIPPPPSEPSSPVVAPPPPPPQPSTAGPGPLNEETNQEEDNNSDVGSDDSDDEAEGWTALMFAADVGDEDCVKVLLSHGADILALSKTTRRTALEIALKDEEDGECAKLLMQRMLVVIKLLREAADMGDRSAGGIIARERQLRGAQMTGAGNATAVGATTTEHIVAEPVVHNVNPTAFPTDGLVPGSAAYGGRDLGRPGYGSAVPPPTGFGGPVPRSFGGPNPTDHGFGEPQVPNPNPPQHMKPQSRGPPDYDLKSQGTWGPAGGEVQDISWIAGGLEGLHLGQGGQQSRGPPQNLTQYYNGTENVYGGEAPAPQEREFNPYRPPGPSYGQEQVFNTQGMMQGQQNYGNDGQWQPRGAGGGQYFHGGRQSIPHGDERDDDNDGADDDDDDQGNDERHMPPDYEGMGYDQGEEKSDAGSDDDGY